MCIDVLFTIGRKRKQPKCPSVEEWVVNMWFIYMIEYWSTIINSEITKCTGKWLEVEKIKLRDIAQTQTEKCECSLISGSEVQIFRCEYLTCNNHKI